MHRSRLGMQNIRVTFAQLASLLCLLSYFYIPASMMNFVILKCPLKDNHGLRVSCPWLVSKAQAIDTIALDTIHHTIFDNSTVLDNYVLVLDLWAAYNFVQQLYQPSIPSNTILEHTSNTRTRSRTFLVLPRVLVSPHFSLTFSPCSLARCGSWSVRGRVRGCSGQI